MTRRDAIVVGAGPNGLVAANLLADAGWSVLVLEAQPEVGGAVRSDRELDPDFVHDTFSAFYPLAAASPTIRGFDLEQHGLRWRHAPAVLGHPFGDADRPQWAVLHRDRELTAAGLDALHPGDGDAWLRLCAEWDEIGEHVVGALLTPFPPVRHGLAALARLRRVGGAHFVRSMLAPVADLGRERFGGEAPRLLLAGNAGHADIPLDAPGSGLFGVLLTMLGQTVGFPVPEGGAGELTAALARRFTALGGEVRCGEEVTAVEVSGGRAVGVRTASGERYDAARGVVADVAAPHLYDRLLDPGDVPQRWRRGREGFRFDPGTVKVDWALDGPVPWSAGPDVAPGTVHVGDSLAEVTLSLAQVQAGQVPDKPFLLTGQMTTSDPTRSPAGTESMWAYTHVPQGALTDPADCARFADRVQDRLERLAPGFSGLVRARRVLGPRDLESRDANLVGGAVNGGSAQLHQQLVFRPVPGSGRAETGVAGLYLASASAHPGGGVHGAPGRNAARAAVLHDRLRLGGLRSGGRR